MEQMKEDEQGKYIPLIRVRKTISGWPSMLQYADEWQLVRHLTEFIYEVMYPVKLSGESWHDHQIYCKAVYDLFINHPQTIVDALHNGERNFDIRFRNHERKKGKLVSCEAYVMKRVTMLVEDQLK